MKHRFFSFKTKLFLAAALITCASFLAARTEIRGGYEGIFVLGGASPLSFTITDDIYHGEQEKVLFSFAPLPRGSLYIIPNSYANHDTTLECDWNEKTGRGYVTSNYPDGSKMVTCFGRFIDGRGEAPAGLFLGGNLPSPVRVGTRTAANATGMAFYDGSRWNHIWCSVNEAFLTEGAHPMNIPPARMKFIRSKVLKQTEKELVLTSIHEIRLPDTTLLMQRYAFFRAGDIHFILINKVRNLGPSQALFSYVYGDEPWVGNYGSSQGDVGWLQGMIVNEEGSIDTGAHTYAGMFDYGNPLVNESHNFTRAANFIEWLGDRPDSAFFSNNPGYLEERKLPLISDTRFIGLQWGPGALPPGGTKTYMLAIGMASKEPMTGLPVKPRVVFPHESYQEYVN